MKNFKFLGIIVMVAVIGFSLAGCDTEEEEDNNNNNNNNTPAILFPEELTGNVYNGGTASTSWTKDGVHPQQRTLSINFLRSEPPYTLISTFAFVVGGTNGARLEGELTSKNGNTYTVPFTYTNYGQGTTAVFTATVGIDGKLTITSDYTFTHNSAEFSLAGTYTKVTN